MQDLFLDYVIVNGRTRMILKKECPLGLYLYWNVLLDVVLGSFFQIFSVIFHFFAKNGQKLSKNAPKKH